MGRAVAGRRAVVGAGGVAVQRALPAPARRRASPADVSCGRSLAGRGGVRLMGFHNPPVPWSEVERVLSGRPRPLVVDPLAFDGGDGATWSRKRPEYQAPEVVPPEDAVPYAELHCHSNFSFLDGASHPEELAEQAARLGLEAVAITDHDGFYGVVRFAEAARELKVPTVFGAELSLELPGPQDGEPDPVGRHLLVLADQPDGYARLSRVLSLAHLAGGEKGRPVYQLEEVAAELSDHVLVLTGCRKGTVPAALLSGGIEAAARELDRLTALFGADRVAVELTDHAHPGDGARRRYGTPEGNPGAYQQLAHELDLIEKLQFPGYFLVVYDIVTFCHGEKIYCQGRGSAANSAVCYALGITNVDAVEHDLLFERFLSTERDGPPDIDVDIESDRREEVIQHVYKKYDRQHTAQVANVVSYRPKSAVRDIAKAFGHSPGQQDAWSKQIDRWGSFAHVEYDESPPEVITFANHLQQFPRHLGIHSGGMVICDRPVIEVCPVEWARMPNRTVLQWDKDDCASVGLVKFDLLGLGMLSAIRYACELTGEPIDLSNLGDLKDPEIYEMLCRADTVGVFQVESRAQMATLPRLKPRKFYDIVVEVALIRPGPIQGGSVHPYIRRANELEEPTPPHPKLAKALEKTLGVPLFQEQLMQMAIDVAGFTAAESDELRRAMSAKRSVERMGDVKERLYKGMAAGGITGALADDLYDKLAAFAHYGFPESHAISFAYLVYASAKLKRYAPAAFCAALLNAQPMGFYSPQSLVDDARRHGVTVRRPDINASNAKAVLEPPLTAGGPRNGPGEPPSHWGRGGPVVRLGLSSVRSLGDDRAQAIEDEHRDHGPYRDMADLARRAGLGTAHLEALATADAFACFGLTRREALWAAGAAAQERDGTLEGTVPGERAPMLPGMDEVERMVADIWATGLSPVAHPVQFARDYLTRIGAVAIADLPRLEHGRRVFVGGIVTHRQRPGTAGGITFMNLEDETGMLNVTCSPGLWQRYRKVARLSNGLVVRGMLEKVEGVLNLRADHMTTLTLPVRSPSRDFR